MKRPPEGAISEGDLRQRIVQLEADRGTTDVPHRRAGAGIGPSQGAIPPWRSNSSSGSSTRRTDASGRRRSSGRSPGGQPGHEGHGRSWVSVEQVDELIPVKPSTCHGCGHPLTGDDPHPQRHQEVVIPPLRAEVIEYQVHTLRCAHCDRLTEAGWPEGVSRHTYGPSVQAWVGLLAGAYRLSKRNIRALLSDAFGLEGVAGYGQPTGTGGDRGPGGSGRGGARLRSPTGHRQRRRDRLAPAPRQDLVVDRGDRGRHRILHSPQPGTRRGR